jgi:hypothetical protein
MEITVNLVGRVPGGSNVRLFSLRKSSHVHLNGVGLKRWLEIDLGPTYRDPLNMTIQFYPASGVIQIVADNNGLDEETVARFRRVVEMNFRNLE